MVLLRLTVKVYPPSQHSPALTSSGQLGQHPKRSSIGVTPPPVSFLLVLHRPDNITLSVLAGMIHEKWTKLRPHAPPLNIKKLVDDEHDQDDLDADLTVTDVFVDTGKALHDGFDQRATVRVVQEPRDHVPVRYPSVVQDWGASVQDDQDQLRGKTENTRLSPIPEEPSRTSPVGSPLNRLPDAGKVQDEENKAVEVAMRDSFLWSVEQGDVVVPRSPPCWSHTSTESVLDSLEKEIADTPQVKRLVSPELGPSPTPVPRPVVQLSVSGNAQDDVSSVSPQSPAPQGPTFSKQIMNLRKLGVGTIGNGEMVDPKSTSPQPNPITQDDAPIVVVINGSDQLAEKTPLRESLVATATAKRKRNLSALTSKKKPRLGLVGGPWDDISKARKPQKTRVEPPNGIGPPSPRDQDQGLGLATINSPTGRQMTEFSLFRAASEGGVAAGGATLSEPLSLDVVNNNKDVSAHISQPGDISAFQTQNHNEPASDDQSMSFMQEDQAIKTPPNAAGSTLKTVPHKASRIMSEPDLKTAQPTDPTPQIKRTQPPRKVVFPPDVSPGRLRQITLEASQKFDRIDQERAMWERKIKAAEEGHAGSKYLQLLHDYFECWFEVAELEKKRGTKRVTSKLRSRLADLDKAIQEKEATMRISTSQVGEDDVDRAGSRRSDQILVGRAIPTTSDGSMLPASDKIRPTKRIGSRKDAPTQVQTMAAGRDSPISEVRTRLNLKTLLKEQREKERNNQVVERGERPDPIVGCRQRRDIFSPPSSTSSSTGGSDSDRESDDLDRSSS